jgi:hypothetical protein
LEGALLHQTMSRFKRILIVMGVVVVVGGLYFWVFGVQTLSALMVQYTYRKIPQVSKVPVPLPDLSVSNLPHKRLSRLGYEFELPWDDVDESKDKTVGAIHVSYFRSGNAFWFSTFPPKDFVKGIMKMANLDPQGFRQLYGEEAFESDYNFHRTVLQVTPSEITPFVSRKQAVVGQMLLMIKAISMPNAASGIFVIQAPDFKGFQFENPQVRPARITDELFNEEGGIDVMFLQKTDGSAPTISQAEMNRVIQSIRKVPAATVASNGSDQKSMSIALR